MPSTDAPTIDELGQMLQRLAEYHHATHELFLSVDHQAAMLPGWHLSSLVTRDLDNCREKAAQLGLYLAEPAIKALRGPTEDQATEQTA